MDAYAAGLIDGEGYIGIVSAGGIHQLRLKVSMADKGRPALVAMSRSYGGKVLAEPARDDRHRAVLTWRLSGAQAATCLRSVQPFLRVKRDIARVALEFQDMVESPEHRRRNGQARWTDDMRERAEVYRLRIKDMNRTGPDPVTPPGSPVAIYRWGHWWEPNEDLFGPVEFQGSWPTSGAMISGHVFALPTWEPPISGSGSSLLPTPEAKLASSGPDYARASRPGSGGDDLTTTVARMLPTPTSRDWKDGRPSDVPTNALLGLAVWELIPDE